MSAKNYTVVEGREGLRQALESLLNQSKIDPQFAAESHFFLYQLANQQSLIRIDPPFYFFHYDLLGRAATSAVKEVITEFLREECGTEGRLEDVSGKEMLARNRASFLAVNGNHSRVILTSESSNLEHAWDRLEQASAPMHHVQKSAAVGLEHFGLFHPIHFSQAPAEKLHSQKETEIHLARK